MTPLKILVATLLVVLVLAFAPPSAWIMRNVADYWRGDYRRNVGVYPDEMLSNTALNTVESPSIPTKLFYDLFTPAMASGSTTSSEVHEKMWKDASKGILERYGNDPVAMGIACRVVCNGIFGARVRTNAYSDKRWDEAQRVAKVRAQANLEIARRAEKIDPDNLHPTMVRALALEALNDHKGALVAIAEAARKPKYTAYPFEEAETMVADREKVFGYRGEFERLVIYFGIMFPHISNYREMGKTLKDDMKGRMDFAKVGLKLAGSDETLIEHFVGVSMVRIAVSNAPEKPKKIEDIAKDGDFAKFRSEADKAGIKESEDFWAKVKLCTEKSVDPSTVGRFDPVKRWGLPVAAFGLGLWVAGAVIALFALKKQAEKLESRGGKSWSIFVTVMAIAVPAFILYEAMTKPGQGSFFKTWLFLYLPLWAPVLFLAPRPRAWLSGSFLTVGALSLILGVGLEIRYDVGIKNVRPGLRNETKRALEQSGLGLLRGQNADNLDTGV